PPRSTRSPVVSTKSGRCRSTNRSSPQNGALFFESPKTANRNVSSPTRALTAAIRGRGSNGSSGGKAQVASANEKRIPIASSPRTRYLCHELRRTGVLRFCPPELTAADRVRTLHLRTVDIRDDLPIRVVAGYRRAARATHVSL